MPISPETQERLKRLNEMIDWVIEKFKVPRAEAWDFVQANGIYKVAERAERIDERARKNELAELHAEAAALATKKAQIDVEE